MCYRTAAAQQAERSRVLNSGILILLAAPVLVALLIMGRARSASSKLGAGPIRISMRHEYLALFGVVFAKMMGFPFPPPWR